MKKLLFLLLPSIIFAQSFLLSNIPLPKTYVQDLDPYECNNQCLQDYLDHGKFFSFMAKAQHKLDDSTQNEARVMLISILNLGSFNANTQLNIALLLPYKKIGKYASSTTNATFAYLITKSHPFMLKSYKVEDESQESLQTAINTIKADGFDYVIAPLTKEGAENLTKIQPELYVYLPTINKQDMNETSPYFTYGAIDYKAQSDLLLKEAVSPLVIFSDRSTTGKKLSLYQKEQYLHPKVEEAPTVDDANSSLMSDFFSVFSSKKVEEKKYEAPQPSENQDEIIDKKVINYSVSRRRTNIENYLKDNDKIIDASFMINTPIVKSGMIMAQLTLYDVNATNLLSTQINYDPLLLSMTQYIDRKNMIIANSITQSDNVLIETNALLSNDIVYDWINYSTTVGVDYFYSQITDEARTYNVKLVDNQMVYDVELLKPAHSKFVKYQTPLSVHKESEQ